MCLEAGAKYDAATQRQIDAWVAAKRARDFGTSDQIRSELRACGVEPDDAWLAMPSPAPSYGPVHTRTHSAASSPYGTTTGVSGGYDAQIAAQVAQWQDARSRKDFATSDAIRAELRAKGVQV